MNVNQHPCASPTNSPRSSQSPETSCNLSSSSSPPRDGSHNVSPDKGAPQSWKLYHDHHPTTQQLNITPHKNDNTVPSVACLEDAQWSKADMVEWQAVFDEGQQQFLSVEYRISTPTENEYVQFMEFVHNEFFLTSDKKHIKELFFWWMWFRKTTMPPDATPAECAMPFLEQVDDPYKHNPTFNPRGKKQKVRLVKVSSIVSALSGDELVVAEAVRDIVEPGRKLRGWAYAVFCSSVAPLKLPQRTLLTVYVLWKVKGGDKLLVTESIDDVRDEILAFAKARIIEHLPMSDCGLQFEKRDITQGRELSARGDPDRWNSFSRFLDLIVKPHSLTFTSEESELQLFKQWMNHRFCWPTEKCTNFKDDHFVLRLTGQVDPVYDDFVIRVYSVDDGKPDEKPIIKTLKGILSSTNPESDTFRAFADERRPLGLTRTSICILYVLWGMVFGRECGGWWVPSRTKLEQRWHEFFWRFKDRDGGVLHDALSPPADTEFPSWEEM